MDEAATPSLLSALQAGAADLGLSLDAGQLQQLLAYQALIAKWNQVYNLTAVRDPQEMLTHHLLDSLAAIAPLLRQLDGPRSGGAWGQQIQAPGRPKLESAPPGGSDPRSGGAWGPRLLDVGSGGGLPGVVIAITCPQITVHCVDTVAKKATFIQQVAAMLKLPNLRGIHARVESLRAEEGAGYDVVCSRAFASLADFTAWSRAALNPGGMWMAMKGRYPADEVAALPTDVSVFHVEQLAVPGLGAERCIVWMRGV